MATMKTLNGYGFNATEFNGKTSDSYTAADSAKLGGKAPEYYLQPRNLLDNSDFRNPVNQRGVSNVATYGYAIDRWFVQNIGGGLSFSDDGVTINATNSLFVFSQKVSKEIRKVLIGKTVTVAATDSSGNVGISSGVIPNFGEGIDTQQSSIGDTNLKVNIYATPDDYTLYIRLLTESILSPVTIVNIALYEGSYTADTLPPYVPKGYAAELAECRRYFRRYTANNASLILSGFVTNGAKDISVNAPELAPMRTKNVSIAYSGSGVIIRGVSGYATECSNSSIYSDISVSPYQNNSSFCATIDISKKDRTAWGLTNNTPVVVNFAANSTLDYIADL